MLVFLQLFFRDELNEPESKENGHRVTSPRPTSQMRLPRILSFPPAARNIPDFGNAAAARRPGFRACGFGALDEDIFKAQRYRAEEWPWVQGMLRHSRCGSYNISASSEASREGDRTATLDTIIESIIRPSPAHSTSNDCTLAMDWSTTTGTDRIAQETEVVEDRVA